MNHRGRLYAICRQPMHHTIAQTSHITNGALANMITCAQDTGRRRVLAGGLSDERCNWSDTPSTAWREGSAVTETIEPMCSRRGWFA